MEKVFEIYIKTTPERLWEAITDRELRAKYNFGVGVDSDWTPGSRYEGAVDGSRMPIARARTSRSTRRGGWCRRFTALWGDDVKREGTSRVTWEIEPVGDSCRLTVTHDQLREDANERALRRLADDPLRPQDAARDRRAADHARVAALVGRRRGGGVDDGELIDCGGAIRRRSSKHHIQSSPGSIERMIGCWASAAWRRAWRFFDESQQPTWPQLMHIRSARQLSPAARHSGQPAVLCGSTSAIRSTWRQRVRCPLRR